MKKWLLWFVLFIYSSCNVSDVEPDTSGTIEITNLTSYDLSCVLDDAKHFDIPAKKRLEQEINYGCDESMSLSCQLSLGSFTKTISCKSYSFYSDGLTYKFYEN